MPEKARQCETCGAVLEPADLFCGECGEPVAAAADVAPPEAEPAAPLVEAEPAAPLVEPAPAPEPSVPAEPVAATPLLLPPPAPRAGRRSGWAIAAAAAGGAGVLLCLVGVAAWALFALTPPAEGTTETDNLVISSLCCGLPLVAPAIVLLIVAAVIWSVRLRKKQ